MNNGKISRNLSELIEKCGDSQRQLAEIAGVSEAFVSYMLAGKKVPSVDVLCRIAKHYGVTVDSLVG